jgi:hypothetical protein
MGDRVEHTLRPRPRLRTTDHRDHLATQPNGVTGTTKWNTLTATSGTHRWIEAKLRRSR